MKAFVIALALLAMPAIAMGTPSGDARSDQGARSGGAVSTETVDAIDPETGKAVKAVVISTGSSPLAAERGIEAP